MCFKKFFIFILISLLVIMIVFFSQEKKSMLPLVAIANYGPHSSLTASINGLKYELEQQGFIDNKTVRYEIVDVGFDAALIPQMMMNLKSHHPAVLVVTTTPVAQYAKGAIQDIPLIFNVITDPVAAGLITKKNQSNENITGSSDKQNLTLLFDFSKRLLPQAHRVGVLYATAEANDIALVSMMKKAALVSGLDVVAVPVDQVRDIPLLMQKFKNAVDFIYVGGSGVIQPTLPVIAFESKKMGVPVFNLNEEAVEDHIVLASFGVDYYQVGVHTGQLVAGVLHGVPFAKLQPAYPKDEDYQGFVSRKNAAELGLVLPSNLNHIHVMG